MDRFSPNLRNIIAKYLAIEHTRKVSRLLLNGLRSVRPRFMLKRIRKCCICRKTSPAYAYLYRYGRLNYHLARYICNPCFFRHPYDVYRSWDVFGRPPEIES